MLEHRRMADTHPVLYLPAAAHQSLTKPRSTLLDGCRWYRLWCSQQQGAQFPLCSLVPPLTVWSLFFQIGVARRKGIDIITNETSQRATP